MSDPKVGITRVVGAVRFSEKSWDNLEKMMVKTGAPSRGSALTQCLTVKSLDSLTSEDVKTVAEMERGLGVPNTLSNLRLIDDVYLAIERAVDRCAPTDLSQIIRSCLHKVS